MKKHIRLILLLMSVCVTGLIGLQLFWNFQNYQHTVKAFDYAVNEALKKAEMREAAQRREQILVKFKGWMADTSLITVTADHNNRDSATVCHTHDTHPRFRQDEKRVFSFGLAEFKHKLNQITPEAKQFLITHFANNIVKRDLEEGTVYNYTQLLGDSLNKAFNGSKVNLAALEKLFKQELLARDINSGFVFNPPRANGLYLTRPVNTDLRKPYKNVLVTAGFESPDIYFFQAMRWVLLTSLLLILITIGCFYATARTLLSQDKLGRLKDDFINNMTHELNTPLASIRVTADALKNFDHAPETRSEYLDMIMEQTDKLSAMSAQILDLGKPAAKLTRIALHDLVARAVLERTTIITGSGATVTFQPIEVFVSGDEAGLLSAFVNIIDNALKYSEEKMQMQIILMRNGKYAEIVFADNGIGVPQEYREQIFEQFFRVPQGNRHDVKGYGIGLGLVSRVVKAHRGRVSVTANQPGGSIFLIQLPL